MVYRKFSIVTMDLNSSATSTKYSRRNTTSNTQGIDHTTLKEKAGRSSCESSKKHVEKSDDFQAAMLNYCNTPQQGHSYSPSQRMMNCCTWTLLSISNSVLESKIIDTDIVVKEINQKRTKAKLSYDQHANIEHFEPRIGSFAYARSPPKHSRQLWIYSQYIGKNDRLCTMQIPQSTIRRNRVHIQPVAPPTAPITTLAIHDHSAPTCMTSRPTMPSQNHAQPTIRKTQAQTKDEIPKPINSPDIML